MGSNEIDMRDNLWSSVEPYVNEIGYFAYSPGISHDKYYGMWQKNQTEIFYKNLERFKNFLLRIIAYKT